MKVTVIPRTYDERRYTLEPEEREAVLKLARAAQPERFRDEPGTRLVVTRVVVDVIRLSTTDRTPVCGSGASWEEWSSRGGEEVQISLETEAEVHVPGSRRSHD